MIIVDKKKRISAEKALKHEWFNKMIHNNETDAGCILDKDVLNRLKAFKGSSKLKRAALNVLVKMLNPKEIENLR